MLSAALVYFGMVSMVPLLIMLMAVPGLLLRFLDVSQAITADVLGFAERTFGEQFRAFLEQAVADLQRDSLIVTLIALGALLFSAALIFRFISLSFRRIWKPLDHQAASMREAMRKTATEKAVDPLFLRRAVQGDGHGARGPGTAGEPAPGRHGRPPVRHCWQTRVRGRDARAPGVGNNGVCEQYPVSLLPLRSAGRRTGGPSRCAGDRPGRWGR